MNIVEEPSLSSPPTLDSLEDIHKESAPLLAKGVEELDLPQISKDRSELEDIQEEVFSKDTDINDDITRAEENSSQSPSISNRKESACLKNNLLADFEIIPIAQARSRRPNKKPVDTYAEKVKFEEEEKKKRLQKTVVVGSTNSNNKPPKMIKLKESEQAQMEIEMPTQPTLRNEVGYQWQEWQLAFQNGLESLSHDEFVNFIAIAQEYKPECVSFEKGHLELKVTSSKITPTISNKIHSKTNQMIVQSRAYMEFFGYIEKIKGKNTIRKFRAAAAVAPTKKPVKGKK